GDGKDDPHHRPEARGPVDARALLELLRDRLEVAHEQPRAERDEERGVGEDQGPRRIAQLEVADDIRERDEEQRRRHQVRDEDGGAQRARHRKLQPRQRVAGEQPAEERDAGGHDGDEERVPEPVRERRLLEQVAEVLQRGVERPERRVGHGAPRAVELRVGTDGRDEHPVEGKEGADQEHGERNVEVDPALPRLLDDHYAPSSRRRYRSCTQTTTNSTGSMKSEMAAPSPRRPVATPTWSA